MNKRILYPTLILLFFSCKVVLINGYDAILDESATKLKTDFNLHFIKLDRTLHDTNPSNQNFSNFQNYYDQQEVDIMNLKDRALYLPKKASRVKQQVQNLDTLFLVFKREHIKGFKDMPDDPDFYKTFRTNVNTSLNAIIKFQQELNAGQN